MQTFIFIMQLIGKLFPVIVETVKAIEAAMPEPGQGQAKLAMVKAAMQSAYDQLTNVQVTFEQVWPAINAVISSVVTAYNASGIFKK